MARTYIENDSGSKSPFDIIIDGTGFSFYGKTPVKGKFGPGPTSAKTGPGETALIFSDFSNGMGMAYSGVPNTYAYTINGYARTPGKVMPGGKLTEISLDDLGMTETDLGFEIRCGLDWLGDVYIGAGRNIIKLTAGGTTPTVEYNVGEGCQIDSAINYNNIPLFSTDMLEDNWQYLTGYDVDISAWKTANSVSSPRTGAGLYATATANPVYLQKMAATFQEVDGIGGFRLIGNDSLFTFVQVQANTIDDIIGDTTVYSSPILVGTTSYAITGIYETNRIFFVTKADGVYGVESSGIYCPNYVPDMKDDPSPFNGVSGKYFAGKLYVGTNEGMLMVDVASKERQDVPILVSPSYFMSNETPVFGLPTTTVTDNGWLVSSIYNGNDSHLCYMRPREQTLATIPNPVIWHGSECTIVGERVTMLLKSSATGRPFMYIGTHNGTRMKLYRLSLPTEGDPYMDYLHGDGHEFSTTFKLFLPFQDGGDPNAKKVIRRFEVQADGVSFPVLDDDPYTTPPTVNPNYGEILSTTQAGEITFYANADAGSRIFFETVEPTDGLSEWVEQGSATSSPRAVMIPALSTISGSQIGIQLVGELLDQSGDESGVYSPFAIRSVKIRTDILVEQLEEKTYVIQISKDKATASGRDLQDIREKFLTLASLQDADAIYMTDEWGDRLLAKVEPELSYDHILERNDTEPTLVVTFRVTFLGRQFHYDLQDTYDGIYAWG